MGILDKKKNIKNLEKLQEAKNPAVSSIGCNSSLLKNYTVFIRLSALGAY